MKHRIVADTSKYTIFKKYQSVSEYVIFFKKSLVTVHAFVKPDGKIKYVDLYKCNLHNSATSKIILSDYNSDKKTTKFKKCGLYPKCTMVECECFFNQVTIPSMKKQLTKLIKIKKVKK